MEINEIVKRFKQNETGAFKMIYENFKHPMLRTAMRMLKSQPDAEDAVQTAFLKLYHGIHNFRFRSQFSTYLFRILINTCYDILNKKKRSKTLPISNKDGTMNGRQELQVSLQSAIGKLPEQMRLCFTLFAVEGFKQTEIAEIMNLTVGGVKSTIYQAKHRLRSMLSDSLMRECQ